MEIAAIVFFIIMLAMAYIVFRVLKRTVKMAMRAIIVLVILGVAFGGGAALWNMNSLGFSSKTKSSKKRSR